MSANNSVAQLNVRIPRDLKERGDATLALVGSSPAKIVRQLWTKLARGGAAYERIAQALADESSATADDSNSRALARSTHLFEDIGASFGLDVRTFEPDLRPEADILEEVEWDLLASKGLA